MSSPSMVHRGAGDTLVVRSVVSGTALYQQSGDELVPSTKNSVAEGDSDPDLPQCKIKRNYSCPQCDYYSQNPRSYLYHLKDTHRQKIRVYECPKCLYASKHSQKLQRHLHMVHTMARVRFKKRRTRPLAPAQTTHSQLKVKLEPMDTKESCSEEDPKPIKGAIVGEYPCSACGFSSRSRALTARHERVAHLKKKFYRCVKCSYVTHMKARYTKHVKYHSMPMIKCELCDFRTPYKWNLDRHGRNHQGGGAYHCSLCNFTADIKQSLTVHEMNHHVPPVGGALAQQGRRRNKVGASDSIPQAEEGIDQAELELLRMEREDTQFTPVVTPSAPNAITTATRNNMRSSSAAGIARRLSRSSPKATTTLQEMNERHNFHTDFIHPDDIVEHRNGSVYIKHLRCRACNYKAAFEWEIARHEGRVHGMVREVPPGGQKTSVKKVPRPIPNLIRIQSKATPAPSSTSSPLPILRIPTVRGRVPVASLLKPREPQMSDKDLNEICAKSCPNSFLKDFASLIGDEDAFKTSDPDKSVGKSSPPAAFKRKNASFFDQLKEKLGAADNLVCTWCGHESKCLSELVRHQKLHTGKAMRGDSSTSSLTIGAAELSSTRCQHCRHRCKTSADLIVHLQLCEEAKRNHEPSATEDQKDQDEEKMENDELPVENKVFVWNELPQPEESRPLPEDESESPPDSIAAVETTLDFQPAVAAVKKVFKCPHCSFWASTASRFHVHIVGHLNKKPFECSLCAYRSNWRWDITKHIRLKSARDAGHERARVLMTDETGRRNYSKYNKYLTLMRVHEATAESSGTGRRSRGVAEGSQGRAETPPLRPPPSLLPAQEGPEERKDLFPEDGEEKPPDKRTSTEGRKTLWKCKKCNYRDASRELVLAHVKEHYQQRSLAAISISGDEASVGGRDQPPFRCGHCLQVSNWKHVIQRHCRLKHSGDIKVLVGQPEEEYTTTSPQPETREPETCSKCPYVASSASDLKDHLEQHQSRPGAIFKCYYCPFYVSEKRELLQHMNLHGVKESEELSVQEKEQSVRQYHNVDVSPGKRYKCAGCPYVSNSKSQFLYHKQFHRPRGAPFKCGLCSYNVSRRHLLHQHLRVHGILVPPQKTSLVKTDQTHHEHVEEVQPLCRAPHAAVDTRGMADVPLVWVSRGDKFFKMFKCRYCPHVNLRKVNIQEHEKMHRARGGLEQDESMASPQQQHHCPDCNYMCNNAGVLSSHAKVHQGVYGHVHCLVDSSKPDSDQVTKLRQYLYEDGDVLSAHDEQIQSYDEDEDDEQNMSRSILNTNQSDEQKDFLAEMQLIANDSGQLQEEQQRRLFFCSLCPARFLFEKELAIHKRFHEIRLAHRCESCSYAARQRHHLLSHLKVHSEEYQQRTVTLSAMYPTSPDHPQPNTAVVMEGTGVAGPLWIVIAGRTTTTLSESTKPAPVKQYPCYMCPAKFFKSVALEYHLSLHGGDGPHKCRRCNYAVKTLGNLAKHEMVHNATEGPQEASHLSPAVIVQQSVPLSGTDLFERKEAQKQSLASGVPVYQPPLHVDPQFGILMHGNPEYIYPTYLKNGRLKEKRYKCHKCPSAFEKREQYKVHLSLHGSKQRYKCEKCDYSVKYYANYIQHMRKHQNNEEAQAAKKVKEGMPLQPGVLAPLEEVGMGTEEPLVTSPPFQPRPVKSIGWSASSNGEPQAQSATERQVALLQQFRRQAGPPEDENRRAFPCLYCPYSSPRKDGLDSHVRRHLAVSGTLSAHTCSHCDYTATQLHFLRDHVRVHFDLSRRPRPEAYMKCERLELTAYSEGDGTEPPDKVLLFRDCGEPLPHDERFEPIYSPGLIESGDDTTKVFIDISTGLSKVTPEAMEPDSMVKVVQDVKLEDDEEEVLVRADKSSDAVIVVSDDAVKSEKESDSSNSTSSSYSSGSSSSSSSSSNNTKSSSTSDSDSQTGDDKRSRSKECELLDNVREEKTRTLSEDEDSCEEESKVLGNVCEVKTRTLSEDEDSCEEENKLLDNVSESGDSELKIKLSCKLSEDSSEVSDWE